MRPRTDEQKAEAKRRRSKASYEAKKAKRKRDPEAAMKYKARHRVQKLVAAGRLIPWPCEVCGEKAEAHHPSYDRPLLVVWLCGEHHRQAHEIR